MQWQRIDLANLTFCYKLFFLFVLICNWLSLDTFVSYIRCASYRMSRNRSELRTISENIYDSTSNKQFVLWVAFPFKFHGFLVVSLFVLEVSCSQWVSHS